MTLEVVEKEVERFTPEEQDRLAAFLVVLRLRRTPGRAAELSRRLDDATPGHWMGLEHVRSGLKAK